MQITADTLGHPLVVALTLAVVLGLVRYAQKILAAVSVHIPARLDHLDSRIEVVAERVESVDRVMTAHIEDEERRLAVLEAERVNRERP